MKEYVSVDVETTGLAPKQDKIIEIGAVRVRDGQIVESFTSFVNPGRILPAHITELTGILQEQVDEAEPMESVLPAFLEFAGDLPLVGHRILFDYGFLKRAAVNMRLDFERSGVDTLKLSRQFLSELPSRRFFCFSFNSASFSSSFFISSPKTRTSSCIESVFSPLFFIKPIF